jgi:hypothetical protein
MEFIYQMLHMQQHIFFQLLYKEVTLLVLFSC